MTPRTMFLLLLSFIAFALSAVVVSGLQRVAMGTSLASAWMMPVLAGLCYTATFFVGRHHILPRRVAEAPLPALLLLIVMTLASMLFVYAVVSVVRQAGAPVPSGVVLALWFFVLWSVVGTLHRIVDRGRLR
jgi:hypothetical protein